MLLVAFYLVVLAILSTRLFSFPPWYRFRARVDKRKPSDEKLFFPISFSSNKAAFFWFYTGTFFNFPRIVCPKNVNMKNVEGFIAGSVFQTCRPDNFQIIWGRF